MTPFAIQLASRGTDPGSTTDRATQPDDHSSQESSPFQDMLDQSIQQSQSEDATENVPTQGDGQQAVGEEKQVQAEQNAPAKGTKTSKNSQKDATQEDPQAVATQAQAQTPQRFQRLAGEGREVAQRVAVDGSGQTGRGGEQPQMRVGSEPMPTTPFNEQMNNPVQGQTDASGQSAESRFNQLLNMTQAAGQGDESGTADKLNTLSKSSLASGLQAQVAKTESKAKSTLQPNGQPLRAHAPQFGDNLASRISRMRIISQPGQTEQMRLRLEPRELGSLNVQLQVDADSQVHVTITAESEQAKEALTRNMQQLRDALAKQDLGFAEMTVEVDDQHDSNTNQAHKDAAEQKKAFGRGGEPEDDLVDQLVRSNMLSPSLVRSASGLSVLA
uniref:Putative Flagellar hook-length control protein FliK n=1 Tax=Magnetococcus massalia (strain MO-1) TaxID=451514 RepID=A0A1S7LKE8_MAGMO|nr:putative Flagellar hook-length control protein FliK [Candidatus Magnetococcus massalia]